MLLIILIKWIFNVVLLIHGCLILSIILGSLGDSYLCDFCGCFSGSRSNHHRSQSQIFARSFLYPRGSCSLCTFRILPEISKNHGWVKTACFILINKINFILYTMYSYILIYKQYESHNYQHKIYYYLIYIICKKYKILRKNKNVKFVNILSLSKVNCIQRFNYIIFDLKTL